MIDAGACLDGRYLVGELLGRGGMSRVHRGTDQRLDRPVAIKVLPETEGDFGERLRQEATVLARLEHPSVVRVLDAHEHEGEPYIVMELVDGPTLAMRLREGPLPADEVRQIALDVAAGLGHAHERDVVHRDLKPANLVLPPGGPTRIVDFGIARITDATHLTSAGVAVGTAAYLAPEQLQGGVTGPPADIYTLGLVLLEALTGQRPFEGTAIETAAARLAATPPIPEELPAPWPGLLATMTALEPEDRPSAEGVLATLDPPARPADDLDGEPTVALGAVVTDESSDAGPAPAPPADTGPEPVVVGAPPDSGPTEMLTGAQLVDEATAIGAVPDDRQPTLTPEPEPALPEPEPPRRQPPAGDPHPVRGHRSLSDIPKRVLAAGVAAVVVLVLVAVLAFGGDDSPDRPDPPANMPPDLADALADLEEAVQP